MTKFPAIVSADIQVKKDVELKQYRDLTNYLFFQLYVMSVSIRVIDKVVRPRSRSPICVITSMTAERIGRNEVLLSVTVITYKKCMKILDKTKLV